MKILAREIELNSNKDFGPYLKSEAKKVWELHLSGVLREIYFTRDTHCAILMLECNDKCEAEKILHSLPLVKEGLITFDIQELVPYDGISRLFGKII